MCYIGIRYIGEFSMIDRFSFKKKTKKKEKKKESDAFNEIL